MSLSKADIVKADDLPRKKLSVPEWGGHVYIRVLTDEATQGWKEDDPTLSEVAAVSLCDKDGVRLFTDKEVGLLGKKSHKVLLRLAEEALTLNGLSKKGSEDHRKN